MDCEHNCNVFFYRGPERCFFFEKPKLVTQAIYFIVNVNKLCLTVKSIYYITVMCYTHKRAGHTGHSGGTSVHKYGGDL
jgi:hypothetical protein